MRAGTDRDDAADRHADRQRAVGRRAVAELTRGVEAPALDAASTHDRACMASPRGDVGSGANALDIDRHVAPGGRIVAELTNVVVAPALDATSVHERARVEGAC